MVAALRWVTSGGDVDVLLPVVYGDVPERIHPVAARSLRAHLLKLAPTAVPSSRAAVGRCATRADTRTTESPRMAQPPFSSPVAASAAWRQRSRSRGSARRARPRAGHGVRRGRRRHPARPERFQDVRAARTDRGDQRTSRSFRDNLVMRTACTGEEITRLPVGSTRFASASASLRRDLSRRPARCCSKPASDRRDRAPTSRKVTGFEDDGERRRRCVSATASPRRLRR